MSTSPTITQLTPQGLIVSLIDDRIAQLTAAYIAIFGVNINLDANSIDGQLTGVFAESFNNLDLLVEAVYQSFNPSTSAGAALSRLVQLNGITRNLGSFSTVTLTCSGNAGFSIPIGSLVTSADGTSVWASSIAATFDNSGTAQIPFQCTTIGPVAAEPGELTKITTQQFGWQTVTNTSAATPGSAQETDAELRIRRAASTATSAQGIIEAIFGAIDNLTGVTQLQVYENYTDDIDSNGQLPHSINCVVLGGDQQAILDTIWLKRSAGCNVLGAISGTVVDSYDNNHVMRFDRPTPVLIYITVDVTRRAGFPSNGATLIQEAIASWGDANQLIGSDVIRSELYTPTNTVPGISISNLLIGFSSGSEGNTDLSIPFNAIAVIDTANIVVNLA